MKPANTRPPVLLPDGAPVACHFMAKTDPPACWVRCEQNATEALPEIEAAFEAWLQLFPKAIVRLYPTMPERPQYLCDVHGEIVKELIS